MDAAVRGDPKGHGEELPHVAADGGIAAAVFLDPVGGKPVKFGDHVVGPGVGRGRVEEPQGPAAVEIIGVAEVAGDEPVALVVDDTLNDVILLAAVAAERQRVQAPGSVTGRVLLPGEGNDPVVLRLNGCVGAGAPGDELVQLECEYRSAGGRVEDLTTGDEGGAERFCGDAWAGSG